MSSESRTFTVGDHTFDLLRIPAGEFLMGDDQGLYENEKPAHRVRLDEFYLGRFPVTQALWKAVMNGENPSYFKGDDRPVEQVSWDDITERFLPALQEAAKNTAPGFIFRLPTEAEWEYAARGGGSPSPLERGSGGEAYAGSDKLKEVGWFDDNSHDETKPVGLKYPNQLGLYDMSGNVWEWCHDWYDSDYYKKCHAEGLVTSPQGPGEGVYRVRRGGGGWDSALLCRAACRVNYHPAYRSRFLGFRLAASFQASTG